MSTLATVNDGMDPFERHGITHLSPSSLALYRVAPALFVLRYLYGVRDEAGAFAARGKAVEAAVAAIVMENASDDAAIALAMLVFERDAGGEISPEINKERLAIPEMVRRAAPLFRKLGRPVACQWRIEARLDGIEVPILGYADFVYEPFVLDLKTTFAIPSIPRADHAVQIAFYAAALSLRPGLIYASPRKTACYSHNSINVESACRLLRQSANAVRAMLAAAESREAAAALFVPVTTDFRWSATTREAAERVLALMTRMFARPRALPAKLAHDGSEDQMTDWLNRSFSLTELVKTGIYVFINHQLKQYYVGKAGFCFGARFLTELGRKQSGDKTVAGYDLLFNHSDTELIYAKSFLWTEKYIRGFDLDALEVKVFRHYQRRYPDYAPLNRRQRRTWTYLQPNIQPAGKPR